MSVPMRAFTILALAVAVGLGTAVSPWASPSPDGLERVAEQQGFGDRGTVHAIQEDAPAPGYAFPGVENERVGTGLAGFLGTLLVFGLGYGAGALLRRRDRDRTVGSPTAAAE
jgi:hypothetical protein